MFIMRPALEVEVGVAGAIEAQYAHGRAVAGRSIGEYDGVLTVDGGVQLGSAGRTS